MAVLRKLAMVWLLALAIPVQGLAAATMVHCGSSHQRMHAAVAPGHSHAGSHHALERQHAMDHGAVAADAADHHHASVAEAAAEPDKYSELAQYKCSACGACCSVAAMPGFSLTVPEPTPVVQWQVAHCLARFGFVTDGPERPPRLILA